MKESFWTAYIFIIGLVVITFIFLFQSLTNSDEHNMALLKETTEGAMYDAIDFQYLESHREYRINREKFAENFLRRFAENASLARSYHVQIFDVNEVPPKASIKVTSQEVGKIFSGGGMGSEEQVVFRIANRIDAILETPY